MLRRASDGPYLSPSELKARDDKKDTILLLLGAVAVIGFLALSLQWLTVGVVAITSLGIAMVKVAVGP